MLSFPTTLNTGGSNINLPTVAARSIKTILQDFGKSVLNNTLTGAVGGLYSKMYGGQYTGELPNTNRLPYDITRDGKTVNMFTPENSPFSPQWESLRVTGDISTDDLKFRNPLVLSPLVYSTMNTYRMTYKNGVFVDADGRVPENDGKDEQFLYGEYDPKALSPSLFNPYYGIQKIGPTKNTPLVDNIKVDKYFSNRTKFNTDFADCSIAKLCELSAQKDGELGQARYKYSDFMYCKDLGMPNNRLITLRRFALPVGDIIMGPPATVTGADSNAADVPGDIGRMVCYFDTEDNKLEDIINYSFNAKFERKEANIEQKKSTEDDRPSPLGMLLNTMSAQYRSSFLKSTTGTNNLMDWGLGKMGIYKYVSNKGGKSDSWYKDNPIMTGLNYDQNKVYNPPNTIRSMYIYDGNLIFKHSFTLTFNYTLRSYDNINPKAAMLDLLANITAVTYRRGNFWGGRQQILGPQPNNAGWRKANNIIDKAWDKLGGIFQGIIDGGIDMSAMLGNLANSFGAMIKGVGNFMTNAAEQVNNVITGKGLTGETKKTVQKVGAFVGPILKSKLKDTLGRPQLYAFNSLLSGDNTGLWHVTIGNPRNPIAVMGNMIVTDTKIQHYGPLGIDDFPTGIKVTVTLEHARPRDMVDIQKMYTRGMSSIYVNMKNPKDATYKKEGNRWVTDDQHHTKWEDPAQLLYLGDYDKERTRSNQNEIA